jgi:hypothetical protein
MLYDGCITIFACVHRPIHIWKHQSLLASFVADWSQREEKEEHVIVEWNLR